MHQCYRLFAVIATTVPADPSPQGMPPAQQAKTDQMAVADASGLQQQPTNIVVTIRVDSPGDDGSISQTNVVVAGANGSNSASTGQDGGAGQNASTDQQADANTNVTQDGAGNYIVIVRINSPGNDGPISQTNAAIGSSNAENTSGTTQEQPTEAPTPSVTSARAPAQRPKRKKAAPRRTEAVAAAPAAAAPAAPTFTSHASDATAPRPAHTRHVKHALSARTGRRRLELRHRHAPRRARHGRAVRRLVAASVLASAEAVTHRSAQVSTRIGRIDRRLDGNVQFVRPVDGNRVVSPTPGRKRRFPRAWVLAGAIAGGLVAPATARAADPFGSDQLVQEVDSAVAQATAAASQGSGSAGIASPETAKTLETATKSLEVATKQAAAVATSAATQAQHETQQAAFVPVHTGAPPVRARAPLRPQRRAAGRRPRRADRSSPLQRAIRSAVAPRAKGTTPVLPKASRATIADARGRTGSARTARATSEPNRSPLPHRGPSLPQPDQPGAALSGQAGGHGPLTPLVLGALAAVLLTAFFEFLPQTLPLRAFRKPRQIALAPWHPG